MPIEYPQQGLSPAPWLKNDNAIVLLLGYRIILVILTMAHSNVSAKGFTKCVGAVGDILDPVLFLNHAAFCVILWLRLKPVARICSLVALRQQITSELPGDKLIIWVILIERMNHPVTPRPYGARQAIILLIAMRVGVPCNIHPIDRHLFTALGRGRGVHRQCVHN